MQSQQSSRQKRAHNITPLSHIVHIEDRIDLHYQNRYNQKAEERNFIIFFN